MPVQHSHIDAFLGQLGQALTSGHVPAIVAAWDIPALVLSVEGGRAVNTIAEIEAFYTGALDWYHSQGVIAIRPETWAAASLCPGLWSVEVRWSACDAAGDWSPSDHSHYVLRETCAGGLRISVAIGLNN